MNATTGADPRARRLRWLHRGPLEAAATVIIAAGVFMLLQPFWLALYTYSFVTTLAGTVLFMVVSKLPD